MPLKNVEIIVSPFLSPVWISNIAKLWPFLMVTTGGTEAIDGSSDSNPMAISTGAWTANPLRFTKFTYPILWIELSLSIWEGEIESSIEKLSRLDWENAGTMFAGSKMAATNKTIGE